MTKAQGSWNDIVKIPEDFVLTKCQGKILVSSFSKDISCLNTQKCTSWLWVSAYQNLK